MHNVSFSFQFQKASVRNHDVTTALEMELQFSVYDDTTFNGVLVHESVKWVAIITIE